MRQILFLLALAASAVALGTGVRAQNDRPATPRGLQGVVLDEQSGTPLRRARIAVSWTGGTSGPLLTDTQGRFDVTVPSGRDLTISLGKAGYAPRELVLTAGDIETPLELQLQRGSVIAGAVIRSSGEPVVGVDVLVRRTNEAGTKYGIGEYTTSTDDRGEFRIGSLAAGRYAVLVGKSNVVLNAPVEPATLVDVGVGEERWVVRFDESAAVGQGAVLVADVEQLVLRTPGNGATIAGRVLDMHSRPVTGGIVQAVPMGDGRSRLAWANAQGRYELTGLPAGTYRVQAEPVRTLALPGITPPGVLVTVQGDEVRDGVDFVMTSGGAMTGTVRDDIGEPVEGSTVQAWHPVWRDGRRVITRVSGVRPDVTDDRGQFRLFGVPPGDYYVSASDSAEPSVPAIFHPGSHDVHAAAPARVSGANDVPGIDITLPAVPLAEVRGRAVDSSGEPLSGSVTLSHRGSLVLESRTMQVRDGTFLFHGIPPGEYVVQALRDRELPQNVSILDGISRLADAPIEYGMTYLTVSGTDTAALTIATSPGSSLAGRVHLENGQDGHVPPGLLLMAVAADPGASPQIARRGRVAPDGTFVMTNLFGPLRFALQNAPAGWLLHSVQIDGINAANEPVTFGRADQSRENVVVVLRQGGARISGQAIGRAGAGALVIVFPLDRRQWHAASRFLAFTTTSDDGRFAVERLPAGEYLVAAVEIASLNLGAHEWRDPDVLAGLVPFAETVTVGQNASASVDVRVVTR